MILRYNIHKLQQLLENFYVLTKARIVVFDNAFEKIAEYPSHDSTFCSLIRKNPAGKAGCLASDQEACRRSKQTQRIHLYTCHVGLTEIVAPIYHGNVIIGYLMFGQVLRAQPSLDISAQWESIKPHCAKYAVDLSQLEDAFFEKMPLSTREIHAAAQILEACASYLWLTQLMTLQENSLPNQIDAYLSDHLSEDLSSQSLCQRFNVSRSKLYRVSSEFFGMGIQQVIRGMRMERAKELLTQTPLLVSEVADAVGFSDYNYFIKVFRGETGVTPLQYRKDKSGIQD